MSSYHVFQSYKWKTITSSLLATGYRHTPDVWPRWWPRPSCSQTLDKSECALHLDVGMKAGSRETQHYARTCKKITKFNSMLAPSAVPGVLEKNKPFPKNSKIERKIICFFKLFGLNLPSIFKSSWCSRVIYPGFSLQPGMHIL